MQFIFDAYALLFGRPGLRKLNRAVLRCALAGLGVLNWRTETLQGERSMLRRLLGSAPEHAVVLDVGANEGVYASWALERMPSLDVHAFEPHPAIFERLQARFAGSRVHCWQFALGDEEGEVDLFDYADRPEGSSHASLHGAVIERLHGAAAAVHRVRLRRLDRFLAENGIIEVFLLKIDTEGNEAAVLRGLGNALSSGAVTIRHLQIEFGDMNVVSRTFLEDLAGLLPGYRATASFRVAGCSTLRTRRP